MGEIERKIRTVKEQIRCTTGEFPFQYIPTMVLIYVVYNVCLWLNVFPIRSGITGRFLLRELVTGLTVNLFRHCQFDVGAYVEAITDAIITNDNSDRTHPWIYLGLAGNRQGSHNCFFLLTQGDRLLKIANSWGKRGKHAIQRGYLNFLNHNDKKLDWGNDDLANLETDRTDKKLVQPDFIACFFWNLD